jgi:hypothetical protein
MNRKHIDIVASLLLAIFLAISAVHFVNKAFNFRPWDYSINWTAAMALRANVPLYNKAALHAIAAENIDVNIRGIFTGPYNSFIGLPTTAMLHLPFTFLSFENSVQVYRVFCLAAMLLSLFLVGLCVQKHLRVRAWLVGLLCLLCWEAPVFSLQLGQVDVWVILALAVSLFSIHRERWVLAGAGIGIATLLKLSPGLLLLYCVLQRRWIVGMSAAIVFLVGIVMSAVPDGGANLIQYWHGVLPGLGDSTRQIQNQALGAFFARLFEPDNNLMSFANATGVWKYAGIGVSLSLLGMLYFRNRSVNLNASDVSLVIFLALLAGPLSWDHYLSWAMLPVMLLATRLSPKQLLLLALLLLPMVFPVYYVKPEQVAANDWWRCITGVQTLSIFLIAVWAVFQAGSQKSNI